MLATISDKKIGVASTTNSSLIDHYEADVVSAQDYYPFGMLMGSRSFVASECHDEMQSLTTVTSTSDLQSGVTTSGNDILHNGVTWKPNAAAGLIYLESQAIKADALNGNSRVQAYLPAAAIEPNTTYSVEFDITGASADITGFNCQILSDGNQPYRAIRRKTGTGHFTVLFTTPAVPGIVSVRINSLQNAAGYFFVVDNLRLTKLSTVNEVGQYTSDFNTATMSGVDVNDGSGQLWKPKYPLESTVALEGTTDKRIKVDGKSINETYLETELNLQGDKEYLVRFSMSQVTTAKSVTLNLYSKTGSTWSLSESAAMYYFGSGDYQYNFKLPAGATAARVSFQRNSATAVDGPDVSYTIDNCSVVRLDTVLAQMVRVCDNSEEGKSKEKYRYGFNGKESDNDVTGDGNQYDYGFRIYNPRIGRFLSIDPLSQKYPWYTPYQFAGNKPISCIDLDGLEDVKATTSGGKRTAEIISVQSSYIYSAIQASNNTNFDQVYTYTQMDAKALENEDAFNSYKSLNGRVRGAYGEGVALYLTMESMSQTFTVKINNETLYGGTEKNATKTSESNFQNLKPGEASVKLQNGGFDFILAFKTGEGKTTLNPAEYISNYHTLYSTFMYADGFPDPEMYMADQTTVWGFEVKTYNPQNVTLNIIGYSSAVDKMVNDFYNASGQIEGGRLIPVLQTDESAWKSAYRKDPSRMQDIYDRLAKVGGKLQLLSNLYSGSNDQMQKTKREVNASN